MTAEAVSPRVSLERATKSERLDLRVSPDQKHLFEDAAAVTDRTLTDFVVQSASVAAHDVLADRTRFVLSPVAWKAFSAALDREPRYLPRLATFLAEPSVVDSE
jgi:uncharacterized protein (DUF1778 family)